MLDVAYYFEGHNTRKISCDKTYSVGKFIEMLKKKKKYNDDEDDDFLYPADVDKNINCAYLRCQKLDENVLLKDYSDMLQLEALFISKNPKLAHDYVLSKMLINLNDYSNIEYLNTTSCTSLFKAIEEKTKKEVIIESIIADTRYKDDINDLIGGYNIINTLNLPGTDKIIGFRYPLSKQEKSNQKYLNIHVKRNNYDEFDVDLTSYIFIHPNSLKITNTSKLVREYIKSNGQTNNDIINPTILSKIAFGVACTLKQLHQKGVIYRQLDFDCIYLNEKYEPLISNFQKLCYFSNNTERVQNVWYSAPETMDVDNYNYSFAVDVYSYGIILYCLFVENFQRKYRSAQYFLIRVISRGLRPEKVDLIPQNYWELIQKCWKQEPSERPSFDEIVEILKSDEFAINEFGLKTNMDELHDYQDRIDIY